MKKIIFVCTGNTCRSPMAEAIFNKKLKIANNRETGDLLYQAESAGILVDSNSKGASANSIDVMKKEFNIDISSHKPHMLTLEDINQADLILCMEKVQAEIIKYKFALSKKNCAKIYALLDYVGIDGDVLDPYGGSYLDYLHTAKQIENAIDILLEKTKEKEREKMIAIGADHGGFALKEQLLKHYNASSNETDTNESNPQTITLKDFGTFDETRGLEEPEVALKVAKAVATGECEGGILICRSGVGMAMAANKVKGIRCGLAYNESVAKSIKQHNNANIIALGADFVSVEEAIKFINIWHDENFLNGIYKDRLDIISEYESNPKD